MHGAAKEQDTHTRVPHAKSTRATLRLAMHYIDPDTASDW